MVIEFQQGEIPFIMLVIQLHISIKNDNILAGKTYVVMYLTCNQENGVQFLISAQWVRDTQQSLVQDSFNNELVQFGQRNADS